MFAAWGPESDKTSTEKVKVELAKKTCMEKKMVHGEKIISFDKVEYIMIFMCIVVSIDNMNVQQENKRIKCPPRAKPTQKPLETQKPSYQRCKKTSENYVYTDFRHDNFFKIIP
jgi:hypothetical protein